MTDIPDGEKWLGSPAQPDKQAKRQMIAIQRLPELLKRVAELEKHCMWGISMLTCRFIGRYALLITMFWKLVVVPGEYCALCSKTDAALRAWMSRLTCCV
jgi:hypothetical protein